MTLRKFLGLILAILAGPALAASEGSAGALRASFAAHEARVGASPFGMPLYLESTQSATSLSGDIQSRIDHRFDAVRAALAQPQAWCEILILHPNVTNCAIDEAKPGAQPSLSVRLGRAEQVARFDFHAVASRDDYVEVRLTAASGPAGTSNYAIRAQAAPLDEKRTILYVRYSHDYGARAKLAMGAYFGTMGRDKVGFTILERTPDGKPVYVDDLRGALERNAMRYYFAIRSHLESQPQSPGERLEAALKRWLAYIERFPRQLAEERGYVERKRADLERYRAAS